VSDSSGVLKAFDPEKWQHKTEKELFYPNGTSMDFVNELEIIPEGESVPTGISNYVFANAFYSQSIYMVDLRTGKTVKEWDFTFLVEHEQTHAQDKLSNLTSDLGDELISLYEEKWALQI